MTRTALFLLLSFLTSGLAVAQDASGAKFEVASVKPVVPDEDAPTVMRGGPGTTEPELITFQRVSLMRVLHAAYGLEFDQVSGPNWLEKELYSIAAKVPPGTTKEQVQLMWQDLLAERFHFRSHFIKKDFAVYELTVAKGGPKFHEEPGFPAPRPGEKWGMSIVPPRNIRQTFHGYSMAEIVHQIAWPLSTLAGSNWLVLGRVINKTGVDGAHDFTLEFAGSRGPGGAFRRRYPTARWTRLLP